mgnify:CR=1 FL=1
MSSRTENPSSDLSKRRSGSKAHDASTRIPAIPARSASPIIGLQTTWELRVTDATIIRRAEDGVLGIVRAPNLANHYICLSLEESRQLYAYLAQDFSLPRICVHCRKLCPGKFRRYCSTACRVTEHYLRKHGQTYNPNKLERR